jgi:predicted nuclease with TOPRIM domain
MSECPNTMQQEHIKELATLRSEVNELKDKMEDMSAIKEAIVKLTILQEKQTEFSEDVSETLKEMKVEIRETKTEVKSTSERVNDLENTFEEKIIEIDNKSKVDLLKIAKDWTPKLIVSGIAYYILQLVGIIGK